MDGVTTEVAQEVGMLLENHDVDSRACEQKSKHHAGWTTACDTATEIQFFLQRNGWTQCELLCN